MRVKSKDFFFTKNHLMENENYSSQIFTERPIVYATFWERVGAALIDAIILGIANAVVNYALGNSMGYTGHDYQSWFVRYYSNPATFINLGTNWLYYALQESSAAQATIGKRAVGMVVTSVDGNRISFVNATGRYFGKILSTLILFIGYLMMTWDDKKQTLHDKMAGTLVVKR